MSQQPLEHLSRITTMWTMVEQAHGDDTAEIEEAQRRLIERYSCAVYRYLLKVLRSADAADEVFQEFALKTIKGGFRHAKPEKGRFRDYLKGSVLRLVTDHYRRLRRRDPLNTAGNLDAAGEAPARGEQRQCEFDEKFAESCREEILSRTWAELQEASSRDGSALYDVLNYRANNSNASSDEIAAALTAQLSPAKPFSAPGIRKTLQRARERFADFLIMEVSELCGTPRLSDVETELIDLGLQAYCKTALDKRRRDANASS